MINVSRVVLSSKLAQPTGFIIYRKSGTWDANGDWNQTETAIQAQGTVYNASPKELLQFPEADRIAGIMKFYSPTPMFPTHNYAVDSSPGSGPGTSDELEFKGDRYRVVTTNDYTDYGYNKVFGVYMEGD